jgi:hypothetical protein
MHNPTANRVAAAAAATVQRKRSPPASPSALSLNPAKKIRCAPSMGGGLDHFAGSGAAVRA